jgi:hypothetical protein
MLFGRLIDEYSGTASLNKAEESSIIEFTDNQQSVKAKSQIVVTAAEQNSA